MVNDRGAQSWGMDTIEIFIDADNRYRPTQVVPIRGSLYDVNAGFRHVEITSFKEGLLPRCALALPREQYNSLRNEAMLDLQWGYMDPYHGAFKVNTWRPGQSYEMHHKIVSGRIPTGLFESCSKLPFNQLLIRAANKLLDTIWGVQANMATQQNRYPILPAPIHFLRMMPVLGYGGLVQRRAQF
jgi:hypothetical protein